MIVKISKGKAENTLTDDDVSNMSSHEILQLFVHANKSLKLAEMKKAIEEKCALVRNVFNLAGTTISRRYEKLRITKEQVDDETWANEDDGADDEDNDDDNDNDDSIE